LAFPCRIGGRRIAMEPRWRQIALWAVACNRECTQVEPAAPVTFREGGRRLLVELAAKFGQGLELQRGLGVSHGTWQKYVSTLWALALAIRDGVFTGRGAATARDLLLCFLGDAGFRLKPGAGHAPVALLEKIEMGDDGTGLVMDHFNLPAPSAGP